MRPMLRLALLALPAVLLAACGDDEDAPRPRKAAVLLFTPKLQGSVVLDTSGTNDAERMVMVVPVSGDSVARFYRNRLPGASWEILSDRSDGDLVDMTARGGPIGTSMLWIHIERQDTLSARYTLIATNPAQAPDTAAGPAPERPR